MITIAYMAGIDSRLYCKRCYRYRFYITIKLHGIPELLVEMSLDLNGDE
jgi:hypothetical protein